MLDSATPTEANLRTGDVIQIPINIESALKALGE
jgi:quercetin dioxygenase-like cupin family protein